MRGNRVIERMLVGRADRKRELRMSRVESPRDLRPHWICPVTPSVGERFLECRLILLGGFCRSVPCQRFRQHGRRVREAGRGTFGHARPRRLTYYQFAITDGGVVLGLGGQSKMIPKSFLKSFKIAVII